MNSKDEKISSIEDLLRKKEKIERTITDQFQEYVTILFTDIAGYTKYVETHGDLAAKSLLQTHNEIIFPIIEKHSGNVIKTIGDAIMASFTDTKNAVFAAVEIQRSLKKYNLTAEKVKQINIRIGIHAGSALKDGDDYFGDAVNIAARIEPTGSAGQIMVSSSVNAALENEKNMFCSYVGLKAAKGKAEPLEIFRVFLDREEQIFWQHRQKENEESETISTIAKPVMRYGLMWKVSLPLTLLLILLFIYPGFLTKMDFGSNSVVEDYINGFMYLRSGDFVNAKNKFMDIGTENPRGQEGLAALAYKKKNFSEASRLSEKSLKLDANILYPHVIIGNILFDKGKLNEAKQSYSEAVNLETPLRWQKGEALFRLGRINSFQNNSSRALEFYNRAIEFDQQNTDIITAKGVLLEKMGELDKALESFKVAQKIAPNDAFVNVFQRSIQQRIDAKQNKDKQDRIDTLINELISNMKNNKEDQSSDRWTSKPITLFFAKMERKGTIPVREGQDDFFQLEIIEALRQLSIVEVVDRELLDKLLQELKMSSSDLADPNTALELGRIISARLIGNLTFIGFENETRLYVKMIETETSAIKVSISDKFQNDVMLSDVTQKIVAQISEKLKSAFPIRGKIEKVDGKAVDINIGSGIGLQKGMILRVYTNDTAKTLVGAVKVVAVEKDKARGDIIKGLTQINNQYLLEYVAL